MTKRWHLALHSLSAQMILSFIALVLLTAAAVGLPAIWLIRAQLERQAWAQVDQARLAAQSLYRAQESELVDLATLIAQRPTLRELLARGEQDELVSYMQTLEEGSGLDAVLLCDADRRVLVQVGRVGLDVGCGQGHGSGFYPVQAGGGWQTWLFASRSLPTDGIGPGARVLVGKFLGDEFAIQMREQTGLDHTLLVDDRPVASSLSDRWQLPFGAGRDGMQRKISLGGQPYYVTEFPVGDGGVVAELALKVSGIIVTQRDIIWTLVGGMAVVVMVASVVGVFLARRIGRPLARLAEAASTLSGDDVDTPLLVETRVREVTLLAHALEGARSDLHRMLSELRSEKAWTDHLLEAIVEGIVTLDRQGRITFFSPGAERITGWRQDEVVGRTCDRVFKSLESSEPFSHLIPAPGRHAKIPVELRDGRQAVLAITGARLVPPATPVSPSSPWSDSGDERRDSAEARVALVFRDVSEEEAMHRLLGSFLANVAHEFRTPLSALAASVELLLDQAPGLSSAELAELLTPLHLGVLGLQTLIDNLLESSSIEAGQFRVQPRPSNLGEIIAEAIATIQPLLDKNDQRLVVQLPAIVPVVQADPRRTVQVLMNLLSNASKYGPDDAEIELKAVAHEGWVRLSVADSGPGVPVEDRSDLFRRFRKPRCGTERAQLGAGLGLSVVKAIVEAHGGEVGIEDRPGGGAVFWFTLPMGSES